MDIKAQIVYKRRPGKYRGKPSVVVGNTLSCQFNVDAPDWFSPIPEYCKHMAHFLDSAGQQRERCGKCAG